jgi:hypothetical protein
MFKWATTPVNTVAIIHTNYINIQTHRIFHKFTGILHIIRRINSDYSHKNINIAIYIYLLRVKKWILCTVIKLNSFFIFRVPDCRLEVSTYPEYRVTDHLDTCFRGITLSGKKGWKVSEISNFYSQHSKPPAGIESTIPATDRPQTHNLDSAATGFGSREKPFADSLYIVTPFCKVRRFV